MKKFFSVLAIIFGVCFVIFEIQIYKCLKEYGYGINQLPKTSLVYFGIINGFTVSSDGDQSKFIGRSDSSILGSLFEDYNDIFEKHGYRLKDRLGSGFAYCKKGSNDDQAAFYFVKQRVWCRWFRVYSLSHGYKIEDF